MILRKGWPDPANLRPAQIWSKGSNAKSCTWSSQVINSTYRIIVGMTNFRILSAWNASIAILNYNTDHEHQYAMSTVNITSTGNLAWNWRCVCRFIAVYTLTYQSTPTSTDHYSSLHFNKSVDAGFYRPWVVYNCVSNFRNRRHYTAG